MFIILQIFLHKAASSETFSQSFLKIVLVYSKCLVLFDHITVYLGLKLDVRTYPSQSFG